ncbi:MAG: CDP-alcohol phosphatidyltransferase family protein [Hasllibacter sp.]
MDRPPRDFSPIQLLPNALTVLAICAGLSAIRFAAAGDYMLAVQLILAACVIDSLDGRLARALKVDGAIGAELDSLADFLNFGVAPPLILYFWALSDLRSLGWLAVLFYAVCCVLRLARFNVAAKAAASSAPPAYFTGLPSPAGALVVLLPMFVAFALYDRPPPPVWTVIAMLLVTGALMVSKVPVWSFKTTRISRESAGPALLAVALLGAAALTFPWPTLVALTLAYLFVVAWGLIALRRKS